MKVINVAGFDVKFNRNGVDYYIPNDSKLHIIPDECYYIDNFQGLLRVIVPPVPVKQIIREFTGNRSIDINEPTIKEIIIEKIEEKKNRPLVGKKIKPKIRKQRLALNSRKKSNTENETIKIIGGSNGSISENNHNERNEELCVDTVRISSY
jgi:hypothetical protein